MNTRMTVFLILLFSFLMSARGQEPTVPRKPTTSQKESVSPEEFFPNLFLRQRQFYPQGKTFLHMDRSHYIPGDTVWFCGYAVDAATHLPDTLSRYMYVKLLNPDGSLSQQIKVHKKEGVFPGFIALPDSMPAGNYTVSAGTLFMSASYESCFFRRSLRVSKPKQESVSVSFGKSKKGVEVVLPLKEGFDVSFFPEGGSLLAGEVSTVGVKALNPSGLAEDITGTLFDSTGYEVATFQTLYKGMGAFAFTPEAGKTYYAVCKNRRGDSKRFELPLPANDVLALRAALRGDRLFVAVGAPVGKRINERLTLLVQSRGIVYHAQTIGDEAKTTVFNVNQFPSGVVHLLLLNENRQVLSERLIFLLNEADSPQVKMTLDKPAYGQRERVQAGLSVDDAEGVPLTGRFSVAVTDDRDVLPDTTYHIFTELLLSSELKGYVESPAWYFAGNEPVRRVALDALMLTQGWRRYNVPALLKEDFQKVETWLEMDTELTGRVKALLSSKPSVATPVHLVTPNANLSWTTVTDEKGRFSFSGINFPDSATFVAYALSKRKTDKVELLLDKESEVRIPHLPIPHPSKEFPVDTSMDSAFVVKADRKYVLENGMRNILLDEVTVRAKAHQPARGKSFYSGQGTLYGPNFIKDHRIEHLDQLYQRLPRVKTEQGVLYIQVLDPLAGRWVWVEAMVLVDNQVQVDFVMWELPMETIESVEVITNPVGSMTAMGKGMIVITTKEKWSPPERVTFNRQVVTLQGYQTPVEFYSPKYEANSEQSRRPDLRTTLYWNPVLHTNNDGKAAFEFYTADGMPTTYSVIMEGITDDGQIVRCVEKVTCK